MSRLHDKNYVSRFFTTTYNLKRREYLLMLFHPLQSVLSSQRQIRWRVNWNLSAFCMIFPLCATGPADACALRASTLSKSDLEATDDDGLSGGRVFVLLILMPGFARARAPTSYVGMIVLCSWYYTRSTTDAVPREWTVVLLKSRSFTRSADHENVLKAHTVINLAGHHAIISSIAANTVSVCIIIVIDPSSF